MEIEQAYIEIEQEWIGDWPGPPPEKSYHPRQYYNLAGEFKKNIRSRSIADGIAPSDHYGELIFDAKHLFDNLRHWMNYSAHMTEKQLEKFGSQEFWFHKMSYEGGLIDPKQDIWPIERNELINDTRQYLESPFMWSDTLDYLLTDALIYAETSACSQSSIVKDGLLYAFWSQKRWSSMRGTGAFRLFGTYIKWIFIFVSLAVAHGVSSELFLALSMSVIAYQLTKSICGTLQSKIDKIYNEMIRVYSACEYKLYNPAVIWDMCRVAREQGAMYDAVLYDLLEKQCVQSAKRWESHRLRE